MKYVSIFLLIITSICFGRQSSSPAPTPKQVLGYELGEKFSSHARIEKYVRALADAVPQRMKIIPYGETYEGRALYIVVFSSEENLKHLEEIRSNIQKLSDPRIVTDAEAERIIVSTPPIVWLSYGVHGNEASSPEAALNVMYQLASKNDDETKAILNHIVVIIDPLLNPDGHERYVNYETTRSGKYAVEDKNAAEHNEDSPSGRTNHYFMDLNRDWAWLTQQESRQRINVYLQWKPQVHVDFHEMGYNSSYFFFPAFRPVNKNFPSSTVEWGKMYGKGNAAAFDAQGLSYWSNERFDLFYPGYGDSWPSLNGAIGMTYEQAGQVGVSVKRSDESVITLGDRLEHHTLTSFATIKTTLEHHEERLRDFYKFFKEAIDEGTKGNIRTYIVSREADPGRSDQMIACLLQQGVEVYQASREFSADNLKTYFSDVQASKKFPEGTYIIKMNQPSKRLIATLFEQEPMLTDTVFYDISTWAMPVAYGVKTFWSSAVVDAPATKITSVSSQDGSVVGGKATYAYAFKSGANDALHALTWLLQHGYTTHVAMRQFTVGKEQFGRGSIIIPVAKNKSTIYEDMQSLAASFHLNIYSSNTGYTEEGINLGSDRAVRLKKPNIIVVTGTPVSTESYGAIWSMFDQEYDIRFIPMKIAQLRNVDLHDYTAMIFPDDNASGRGYKYVLDSMSIQKIKTWIAGGGTFVGIEGGAAFASASVGKIASVKFKEKKKDEGDDKKDSSKKEGKLSEEELEKRMTVEERERKDRLNEIPGTMMRVTLDTSHPLGFGYDKELIVFKTGTTMFELSESGYNVGMYTKSPRVSGYISKENEKKLQETPFLIHEQLGSGNIVLFTDDPNFRLFWKGLNVIFLNSVLIMPSIRDVTMTAE